MPEVAGVRRLIGLNLLPVIASEAKQSSAYAADQPDWIASSLRSSP
jgi:hypothetical protein